MQRGPHELIINAVTLVADFFMPSIMQVASTSPLLCFRYRPALSVEVLEHAAADGGQSRTVIALRGGNRPTDPGLMVHELGQLTCGLLGSEAYVARHGHAESAADLDSHAIVHADLDRDTAPWEHWLTRHAPPGLRIIMCSNDEAARREAVRSGHCAGFFPVSSLLTSPHLRMVMPPQDDWAAPLWMVTPPCDTMPPPVAEAVERLGVLLSRCLGRR